MDLSFGAEYETFRTEVKDFIANNRESAPTSRSNAADAKQWQKTLIENGYTARTIPDAYGGYGAKPDIIQSRIIAEEFADSGIQGGMGGQGISMLVPTLLEVGNEEQKLKFVKPTIEGDMVWCQGYSEPGAGSDLASLRTNAVMDGDEWVINGQKIWTSTAHLADWIFCLVRTEPDAKKHHGISFLLFSMDTPGIEIRPLVDMTGVANFNEVFFTDVRVPAHQIVGNRGQGWQVANSILGHERDMLGNPDRTPASATEVAERMADLSRRMGAAFGRLQAELVQPVLQRVIYILKKQGRIDVPAVNGREVKVRSVSPLAQAQANQDISTVARFLELVGGTFGPEMLQLLVDSEKTAVHLAKKFGVPESLIRDADQRKQIAAMAQQMAQQQMQAPQQEQPIEQQG